MMHPASAFSSDAVQDMPQAHSVPQVEASGKYAFYLNSTQHLSPNYICRSFFFSDITGKLA